MIDLVTLDMAGTTVRNQHEVEGCFAQAARETGLNMTGEDILQVQGQGKRQVFEQFWAKQLGERNEQWEAEVETSYNRFRAILEQHYQTAEVVPTDGCLDLLQFLQAKRIPVALTTGFYREVTNIILDRLGWLQDLDAAYLGPAEGLIQFSISSDQVPAGRPAPYMIFRSMEVLGVMDVRKVIAVGDTPSDLLAGRNAGCEHVIGLTNGTHQAAQLQGYDHDLLLNSIGELIGYLEARLPA